MLFRSVVRNRQFPCAGVALQVQVHALDRDYPVAVRLDDRHILEPDGRGVLDGLVSGDNPALYVDQDAPASPILPQAALNLGLATLRTLVGVPRVGSEVRELRNFLALFQIPPNFISRSHARRLRRGRAALMARDFRPPYSIDNTGVPVRPCRLHQRALDDVACNALRTLFCSKGTTGDMGDNPFIPEV